MDTFLETTTLEPRPRVLLKAAETDSAPKTAAVPGQDFMLAMRHELLKALTPFTQAHQAATDAFERVFKRFGME